MISHVMEETNGANDANTSTEQEGGSHSAAWRGFLCLSLIATTFIVPRRRPIWQPCLCRVWFCGPTSSQVWV